MVLISKLHGLEWHKVVRFPCRQKQQRIWEKNAKLLNWNRSEIHLVRLNTIATTQINFTLNKTKKNSCVHFPPLAQPHIAYAFTRELFEIRFFMILLTNVLLTKSMIMFYRKADNPSKIWFVFYLYHYFLSEKLIHSVATDRVRS